MKNYLKNSKGFTLMEVMASLSLLVIFTGSFLLLLSKSYTMIFDAGKKSNAIYLTQKDIEKVYSNKTVDQPSNLVLSYSGGGSKTIAGGLKTIENTSGNQVSKVQTFIPFSPLIELYNGIDSATNQKLPAFFNVDDYPSKNTLNISCVNFSYIDDSCSTVITNVNNENINSNFYTISQDLVNNSILNLTFNTKPEVGTYTVIIKNFENSFSAKGIFTIFTTPLTPAPTNTPTATPT